MAHQVGQRVFAIRDADDNNVYSYGFGVYVGNEVPDGEAEGLAEHLRIGGQPNPKIVLDNGKVVWGCECWWGPEEKFQDSVGHRKVLPVDIDNERAYQKAMRKAELN